MSVLFELRNPKATPFELLALLLLALPLLLTLRGCMESGADSVLNHRAEKVYSDPQTLLYDKNFDEARAADEVYEWSAEIGRAHV